MILKGNEDLRVVKTIESIKAAFEELICEKDYEKITVKELCDRARINKKTFYHYYETLDFLLAELQTELSSSYLERIKDFSLPEDLPVLYMSSRGSNLGKNPAPKLLLQEALTNEEQQRVIEVLGDSYYIVTNPKLLAEEVMKFLFPLSS